MWYLGRADDVYTEYAFSLALEYKCQYGSDNTKHNDLTDAGNGNRRQLSSGQDVPIC